MSAADLRPGRVVVSLAGRDRGRRMVILKVLDDRFVLVADGSYRTVNRPKRKNARHLRVHGGIDEGVARDTFAGRAVTDKAIREALQRVSEEKRDV